MFCYTTAVLTILMAKWTRESFVEEISEDQKEFVKILDSVGDIKHERVKAAMNEVDRKLYRPKSSYEDYPNSDPLDDIEKPLNMQAYAMRHLIRHLRHGNRVLDINSGSGYLAVCMAYLVGIKGLVVGVLPTDEQVQNVTANVKKFNPNILKEGRIKFIKNVITRGYPEDRPYDAIHVGEELATVPQALLKQMKKEGRLMVPIASPQGYKIYIYDKHRNGSITNFLLDTLAYDKPGCSPYNYRNEPVITPKTTR